MGALRVLTEDLELAEYGDAVLVIDDLHRVDDSPLVQSVLAAFVENKPDALHLLLLSRRRPALPIDRLRATGRLADITFDVLKFSEAEALEMLGALCPDTAPQELRGSRHVGRRLGRRSAARRSRRTFAASSTTHRP